MQLFIDILGWVGAASVLGGYLLVTTKRVLPDSISYQGLNAGGSLMLAVYAYWYGAIASVTVNVIWLGIGVLALAAIARKAVVK